MHGWRLAILIRNYWREAAIPASSLGSRSRSSRSFGRLSAVARNEEEAARAASSLARSVTPSRSGSNRSDPERVRGFAVHRRIESLFSLGTYPDRSYQVDHLQHHVGKRERVGRAAHAGGELFPEERGRAVHEALRAAGVDRSPGEDAEQDDAEQAAHT